MAVATSAAKLETRISAAPSPTPGTRPRRRHQGDKRKETQRLMAQRAVALPGDRLEPSGVPAEQSGMDPRRHAGVDGWVRSTMKWANPRAPRTTTRARRKGSRASRSGPRQRNQIRLTSWSGRTR